MLFIAFLRLFQSSVIRLLLHLIRSRRAFSTCFPNTAQLIGYSFMDNYCAVCFLKVFKMEKNPKTLQINLLQFPPPSYTYHASISQILLRNKAEIKRLYAQTEVQWEPKRGFFCLRRGRIAENVIPWEENSFLSKKACPLKDCPVALSAGDAGRL